LRRRDALELTSILDVNPADVEYLMRRWVDMCRKRINVRCLCDYETILYEWLDARREDADPSGLKLERRTFIQRSFASGSSWVATARSVKDHGPNHGRICLLLRVWEQ
jgi:hypothetical protein